MNKDLIETPRFIRSLGAEVLLKGRLVAFDIDENNRVENVVRLEHGETINVPDWNIYTKNNIIYEPEKVKVQQFVADFIAEQKKLGHTLSYSIDASMSDRVAEWYWDNSELFARAWLDGYEVEEEKKYKITLLNRNDGDLYLVNQNANLADKYGHFSPTVLLFTKGTNFSEKCYKLTKKEVVLNDFGWVFDCPGIEIEEVE